MWPMLRAIKHRLPDGSDGHILDIGPVYQEAYNNLKYYAQHPRFVLVSGDAELLWPRSRTPNILSTGPASSRRASEPVPTWSASTRPQATTTRF